MYYCFYFKVQPHLKHIHKKLTKNITNTCSDEQPAKHRPIYKKEQSTYVYIYIYIVVFFLCVLASNNKTTEENTSHLRIPDQPPMGIQLPLYG